MDYIRKISWLILLLASTCFGTFGDKELEVDGAKWIWNNNSQIFSIAASGSMSESIDYIWPPADAIAGGQALLSDASGVLSWGIPTTAAAHNVLSTTHDATTSAVTAGDLIFGNATPKWDDLAIGASNEILRVSGGLPDWQATTFITELGTIVTGTWNAGAVSAPSLTDGTVTITGGNITGVDIDITVGTGDYFSRDNGDITTLGGTISAPSGGTISGSIVTDGFWSSTAGSFIGVVSIAGADADVSAGTGDYTSSGDVTLSGSGTVSATNITDTVLSINAGSITSAVNGTFSGTVQAEQLTSTDDITTTDRVTCAKLAVSEVSLTNGLVTFGGTATGNNSIVLGSGSSGTSTNAVCLGASSSVSGTNAGVFGTLSTASASQAYAFGLLARATASDAIQIGNDINATATSVQLSMTNSFLHCKTDEAVFNEDSQDTNFRIETNDEDNFFFIDAASNWLRVGDWDTKYTQILSTGQLKIITTDIPQLQVAYDASNISNFRTVSNGRLEIEPGNGIVRCENTDGDITVELESFGASPGDLSFKQARNTTADPHIVQDNDSLGEIKWRGHDGNGQFSYETAASIQVNVDGTPGVGVIPTCMQLETTDSAGNQNIHLEINAAGSTFIGEGDDVNNTQFEPDGTLVFVGDANVWKDINVGAAVLSRPAASQPVEGNFLDEGGGDTGITTLAYAIGDKASGSIEMQHDYKEGSDFTFHVHWQGIAAPSTTDNVQWRLTYSLMRNGTTLDSATIIDSPDTAIDTQYESYRSDFAAIDGSTAGNNGSGVLIEDQFIFTIERVAATGDVYAGDALVATVGIHYELDMVGSRGITTK